MSKALKSSVYTLLTAIFVAAAVTLAPPVVTNSTAASADICEVQAGTIDGEFTCFDVLCETSVCCWESGGVCDEEGEG